MDRKPTLRMRFMISNISCELLASSIYVTMIRKKEKAIRNTLSAADRIEP